MFDSGKKTAKYWIIQNSYYTNLKTNKIIRLILQKKTFIIIYLLNIIEHKEVLK